MIGRSAQAYATVTATAVVSVLLLTLPARSDGPRWRPLPWQTSAREAIECPAGTLPVVGSYCPDVEQVCLEWSEDGRDRCLRFAAPSRCRSRHRRPMAFCMDAYEWPGRPGMHPDVMVSFVEAQSLCAGVGRRLCTETEWTFACEGDAMLPYPYGYVRDASACTIDHFARPPNRTLLDNPLTSVAEASRVYEASASGARPRCASPFGVLDMTGNVDEWVVNERGVPFSSSLMGGFWGHVRTRCRAQTRSHFEAFRYYQIGFRCCADALHTNDGT